MSTQYGKLQRLSYSIRILLYLSRDFLPSANEPLNHISPLAKYQFYIIDLPLIWKVCFFCICFIAGSFQKCIFKAARKPVNHGLNLTAK